MHSQCSDAVGVSKYFDLRVMQRKYLAIIWHALISLLHVSIPGIMLFKYRHVLCTQHLLFRFFKGNKIC